MLKKIEDIANWLDQHKIENYAINDDLTVDVAGSVNISDRELTDIPIQFRKVSGNFNVSRNELTSLKGSPKYVGGWFFCSENELSSLHGSPEKVGGSFGCSNNNLTTLEGSPEDIGGYFDCEHNKLTNLQGSPKKIYGSFHCCSNPISSLGNIDTQIEGVFLSPLITEFTTASEEFSFGVHRVLAPEFNTKVNELKSIREEKDLLESSVAKLCDTPQIGNAPKPQVAQMPPQQPITPKRKFKL